MASKINTNGLFDEASIRGALADLLSGEKVTDATVVRFHGVAEDAAVLRAVALYQHMSQVQATGAKITTGSWAAAHGIAAGTVTRWHRVGGYVSKIGAEAYTIAVGRAVAVVVNQNDNDAKRKAAVTAAAEALGLTVDDTLTGKAWARIMVKASAITSAARKAERTETADKVAAADKATKESGESAESLASVPQTPAQVIKDAAGRLAAGVYGKINSNPESITAKDMELLRALVRGATEHIRMWESAMGGEVAETA